MAIFASKSARAFYDDTINPILPEDAEEITAEFHRALLAGESSGKSIIKWSVGAAPMLADKPPPTQAELAVIERRWRDEQLLATDPIVTRHRDERDGGGETTLTDDQYSEFLRYRQDLRKWPQAEEFLDSSKRPIAPAWLPEQLL